MTFNKTLRHLLWLLAFISLFQNAHTQIITGKILNLNNEPVPYSTIFIQELNTGTISNSEGNYRVMLDKGNYHFTIRCLGYKQLEKNIVLITDSMNVNFSLENQDFKIQEIKVFGGKDDPALNIMRKAIANAPYYRQKIKHYEADLYLKGNFIFKNILKIIQNKTEVNGKKMKEVFQEG